MQGSGLAAPRTSMLGIGSKSGHNAKLAYSFGFNVQSHANDAGSEVENLIIDAETHTLDLTLAWNLTPQLQVAISLARVRNSAGHLDNLISEWHSVLDLPGGDRENLVRDGFLIAYDRQDAGSTAATGTAITQSQSGFADTELSLAYQVLDQAKQSLSVYGFANLPTGNARKLTGSDKIDAGFEVAYSALLSPSWAWHLNLGGVLVGDDSLHKIATQQQFWTASIGTHWQANDRLRWSAQLDGHGAVFESLIEELSEPSVQLAIGLAYGKSWQLYFAEDLSVNHAADFSLGLRWRSAF